MELDLNFRHKIDLESQTYKEYILKEQEEINQLKQSTYKEDMERKTRQKESAQGIMKYYNRYIENIMQQRTKQHLEDLEKYKEQKVKELTQAIKEEAGAFFKTYVEIKKSEVSEIKPSTGFERAKRGELADQNKPTTIVSNEKFTRGTLIEAKQTEVEAPTSGWRRGELAAKKEETVPVTVQSTGKIERGVALKTETDQPKKEIKKSDFAKSSVTTEQKPVFTRAGFAANTGSDKSTPSTAKTQQTNTFAKGTMATNSNDTFAKKPTTNKTEPTTGFARGSAAKK